ncbi:ABC transporter ATP-binding protein [Lacrimispora saccharolytica]|uniref:ABC transporter related protein n=1 Tax=Lacrimispora saccharolytica (strain ATCC 35040 / DSM 2544 / NRCC 2533 / WM1) TaxID=610130 RepID=D9RAG1_LACSW|nr:ABC transporter ATP-binding protein [Lacrimispora saccharolytica]ADL04239.1 ABC transporter related protein [[Clostridium] saccharolyticum WM1]QRV21481.1 ABC transporter ATP-binding protein [Lacrimispora saccharolytica]
MNRYWKYIRPYLGAFILAPLLMLTEVLGEIMLPKLTSMIINNGVAGRDMGYILSMGGRMLAIAVFMAAGGIGGSYFSSKASICFSTDLRKDVFHKVQQFSFNNIDDFSTGSLVTRLTNDIQQIQNVVMLSLRMMFRAPGMLIGGLIMAYLMNRQLMVVLLAVIPVLILSIFIILKMAFPRFEAMQKKIDRLNSGVQEALTNVRVIKSFVREDYEEQKFQVTNKDLKEGSLDAMKIVVASMPVMMLAMNVTTLAVVWYGGNLIIAGKMPVGDLTAFTTYIVQILMSLMLLSMVFLQASRAMASLRRVREVLDTEIDLTDEHGTAKSAQVIRGKVEFKNVSFQYTKGTDDMILKHIDFVAEPGETIGIIGSTGSGKTSLVQLIPRLYDADEGQVLVDGIDVKDYSIRNLRKGVGMVLQKNVLFSGTIEENLRWGSQDATMEEVILMAESAQADGFVSSFTDGYDTDLGQGGANVSGGQKQRLCIARALLKKPKILILDDSTSAVDTATEARIRQCFQTTLKDTTKFIIAQRIGSVENADKIIVLDDGQIAGIGTHEELLVSCEAYQEIYYSQREREEEAGA